MHFSESIPGQRVYAVRHSYVSKLSRQFILVVYLLLPYLFFTCLQRAFGMRDGAQGIVARYAEVPLSYIASGSFQVISPVLAWKSCRTYLLFISS
jgi:hypothetical protein